VDSDKQPAVVDAVAAGGASRAQSPDLLGFFFDDFESSTATTVAARFVHN